MNKFIVIAVVLGAFFIGILIGKGSHIQTGVVSESETQTLANQDIKTSKVDTSQCSQQLGGTEYMRCLLVKAEQETNYRKQRFNSAKHNQIIKEQLLSQQKNNKLRAQKIKYFRSILHEGKPLDAIALIEQELTTAKYSEKKQNELLSLLAISYIRLGEETHCVQQDNPNTCIFPLSRDAIYAWKEGSRKAIQIYKGLLTKDPENLNARWLMNLASMTIDEPLNVQNDWLVSNDYLGEKRAIEKFNNIAHNLNLDVNSLAGSPIIDDFNGDGWLDVIVSSWGIEDQIRLFINNGSNGFTEKTTEANLIGITGGLNLVQADYDNDGCIDVLILRGAWLRTQGKHPNSLLKNDCNGKFVDVTRDAGLLSFYPSQTAAWTDFDLDGYLDVFIGNEEYPSELFRNNGDGTFTNLSEQTGLVVNKFVKGVDWGDINNDKLPDLYISVLKGRNYLYQNMGKDQQGQWHFKEVGETLNVMEPIFSFPTAFLDYNNDGWQDIIVLSYERYKEPSLYKEMFNQELLKSDPTSVLYKNNGDGTFTNVSKELNINKSVSAMGFNHGDIDNDGYQDIYIGTGSPDFRSTIPNFMFRNHKGEEFTNVTAAGGFGHVQKGHGISFADFDNDGDQDVYAVMGGAFSGDSFQNALYENPGNTNHWLKITLQGNAANKSAIGARIKVTTESNGKEKEIHIETGSGGSFGANPLWNEIGLGDASSIKQIEITWPSSSANQVFKKVDLDQHYLITEGDMNLQVFSPTRPN